MTDTDIRWIKGEPALQRQIDAQLADATVLAESSRRCVLRLSLAVDGGDGDLLVKRFRVRHGARRWRERAKRLLGRGPDQREWRALTRLHAAGIACPEPLARGQLGNGETVLVQQFVEGPLLGALIGAPGATGEGGNGRGAIAPAAARGAFVALGKAIAELHREGWVHGDLHVGNILIANRGPLLLDLQRCRRDRRHRARIRDLGFLDFSLAQAGATRGQRMRVRKAALGIDRPASEASRQLLRSVALAARRRAQTYYRGRTARCLRDGGGFRRVDTSRATGMRSRDFPETAVREALAAHASLDASATAAEVVTEPIGRWRPGDGPGLIKRDHRAVISAVQAAGRSVVVKQVVKAGLARRFADVWRGSPARRGWVGGNGLLARGIAVAEPLAYLEQKRFGFAVCSWLILEDLRARVPVFELNLAAEGERPTIDSDALASALAKLARRLHERGILHDDLQAVHIYLKPRGTALETSLIDFEGIRFVGVVREAQRLSDLSSLNASVADDVLSLAQRMRALHEYARALPFARGLEVAQAQIAKASVERGHFWRGTGCGSNRAE